MGISAKGAHPLTTEWIKAMLESTTVGISGGCPQGRFLSPLLCCLVADALIGILTSHGYEMRGYGDDLLSMIKSYRNFKMKLITWRLCLTVNCHEGSISITFGKSHEYIANMLETAF